MCSPKLITFCLFMRLPGGRGLPRAGCRAAGLRRPGLGRGLFGDKGSPGGGTTPPDWHKKAPRAPGAARRCATRGGPRRCSAAADGRPRIPRAGPAPLGQDPYPQGQIRTLRVRSAPPGSDPYPQGWIRTPRAGPAPPHPVPHRSPRTALRKRGSEEGFSSLFPLFLKLVFKK